MGVDVVICFCRNCAGLIDRDEPKLADIIQAVAIAFEQPVDALQSPRRTWDISHARQTAHYLARKHTHKSLPDIGRRMGKVDHTTVIHGIKQVERRLQQSKPLAALVEYIEGQLR